MELPLFVLLVIGALMTILWLVRITIVFRVVNQYIDNVYKENLRRIGAGQYDSLLSYRNVGREWSRMEWDLRKWRYADWFPEGY